jgi:hypothetical protein
MSPAEQLRDVVDYLENPEVIVAEFVDAYCAIEGCADADELILEDFSTELGRNPLFAQFGPGVEIALGEESELVLRCVGGPASLLGESGARGVDYVALIQGDPVVPVLGVIQSGLNATPFSLLLRALVCLTEVAPAPHLERVNERLFKGALGAGVRFDLHIAIASRSGGPEQNALWQLTRDLADGLRTAIADEWQFPDLLHHICALHVDPRGRETPRLDWVA